jgi:uncharacterized membrane protein YbhN (UPF0104 family)
VDNSFYKKITNVFPELHVRKFEKMGILKKLLHLIGIVLLVWILYTKVNLSKLPLALSGISYPFLFVSIIAMIFVALSKYLRIFLLLKTLHVRLNPIVVLKIYTSSALLSQITTLVVSTFAATAATIVSHKGEKKVRIGNAYILSNLSDLLFAALILSVSLFLNRDIISLLKLHTEKYTDFFLLIFLLLVFAFFILRKRFQRTYKDFIKEVKFSIRKTFLLTIFTTVVVWIWYTLTCFFEIKCFGVSISISYLLLIYTAGSIITALPISIAGLGTRDLVFIYLLSHKGVSPETAFILSLFSYILNPTLSMFLLYIVGVSISFFRRGNDF